MAATHHQGAFASRTGLARVPAANAGLSTAQHHSNSIAPNVSLFLTNLHLLDLDLLPDWPDINASTFISTKDAAQGQKKRIQCVEWALYQLFVFWDPDEARNKLKPFFPPLDQLQSTNLRAALLRSLEQLKKNGVLGRDAILRKTMLDECKGERLEEVLAVLSSAVLKKVIGQQKLNSNTCPAIAHTLALENRGLRKERADLDILILAHKVSLRKKLDQKAASRIQYKNLAKLLDMKEQSISNRRKAIQDRHHLVNLPGDNESGIRRTVRNSWAGDEQWQEALMSGDSNSYRDNFLNMPFDRVWSRTGSNRLQELDGQGSRLVDQLDSRVRAQQERLSRWQKLRGDMFGHHTDQARSADSASLDRQKGVDLAFGIHESLQLDRTSPQKLAAGKAARFGHDYSSFLQDMEMELSSVTKTPGPRISSTSNERWQPMKIPVQAAPATSRQKEVDEPVSELSELEDEPPEMPAPQPGEPLSFPSRQVVGGPAEMDTGFITHTQRRSRPKLPQPLSSLHAFLPKSQSTEIFPTEHPKPRQFIELDTPHPRASPPIHQIQDSSPFPARSPTRSNSPSLSSSGPRNSPPRRTKSPEELPPCPAQQQADQILASMSAASPSPAKQPRPRRTLSLADRTRLSMVRGASAGLDDEDEIENHSPTRPSRRATTTSRSPTKRKPATPTTIPENAVALQLSEVSEVVAAEEDDLVARTRRSMANFEAAEARARLERQRSEKWAVRQRTGSIARQHYFDPEGDDGAAADSNSTVVLEQLIAKEADSIGADYESIFKSRPKIKTSPPTTPIRGASERE